MSRILRNLKTTTCYKSAPSRQRPLNVREAALVMVSEDQERLDVTALTRWANGFGIGLTLFHGWTAFIDQALFWSHLAKPIAAGRAVRFIHKRLVKVEASPEAVALWGELVAGIDERS